MHSWKPRILTAVPQLPHVRFEIAEAMHKLAAEIEADNALRKRSERAEAERELGNRNFNPNEPRVPAGRREGGQWTNGDWGGAAATSSTVLSDALPDNFWRPGAQYAANETPLPPGMGHNQGPPLEPPPEIPPRVLATKQAINNFLKAAAYWSEKAAKIDKRAAALFMAALMVTAWLADKYLPYAITYLDPPRTLTELQQAATLPKIEYYNDHHMAEQTAAENDGFPRSKIDAPENLARIPTLKHWLITGWYQVPNPEFGWKSPREYLRGKSWEERVRLGKKALVMFGVLKP